MKSLPMKSNENTSHGPFSPGELKGQRQIDKHTVIGKATHSGGKGTNRQKIIN